MSVYIWNAICGCILSFFLGLMIRELLEIIPYKPKVRCKECRYYNECDRICDYHSEHRPDGTGFKVIMHENDYCSMGKKEEAG